MEIFASDALNTLSSENKLHLKTSNKRTIIDFVSNVLEMTTKVVTCNNIMLAFEENEIIDKELLQYPNLNKILATCQLHQTT